MALWVRVRRRFTPRCTPRLVIPTGILRIPVFSSPVALFSQEPRFLFLGNFLGTPSGILSVPGLLYQAYVHRNSPAIPSKTTFLQKIPQENTGKKILRNPVRNAILGPKKKFLKIGITNLGVRFGSIEEDNFWPPSRGGTGRIAVSPQ
jgi:hypothetical protein